MKNPNLIVFDVNETLLNMSPLKANINNAFQHDQVAEIWFEQLLHYSLVEGTIGNYQNFSEIARAVLQMNAVQHNLQFTESDIQSILEPITQLTAYPDVPKGFEILKEKGYRLVALSNGKPDVLKEQLNNSNLAGFLDNIYSIEGCKKYKPHPEAYHYVLESENCSAENAMMVAAHGWDIYGASEVGMQTAFIRRQDKVLYPLSKTPDFDVKKITDLAEKLR